MEFVGERKGMEGNRWEEKKERERQRGMVRYETMEWGREKGIEGNGRKGAIRILWHKGTVVSNGQTTKN